MCLTQPRSSPLLMLAHFGNYVASHHLTKPSDSWGQLSIEGTLELCATQPDVKGYLVRQDETRGAVTNRRYLTSWG